MAEATARQQKTEMLARLYDGKLRLERRQNHAAGAPLHFFVFDVLILAGRDVMGEPLTKRRELMEQTFLRFTGGVLRASFGPVFQT